MPSCVTQIDIDNEQFFPLSSHARRSSAHDDSKPIGCFCAPIHFLPHSDPYFMEIWKTLPAYRTQALLGIQLHRDDQLPMNCACYRKAALLQRYWGYNLAVRRLLAILQLLLLVLPIFASASVAAHSRSQANLPACCRRNGAHHCMLSVEERAALTEGINFSTIPQRCPYCPNVLPAAQHAPASLAPAATFFAHVLSQPTCASQTSAKLRISRDRSRQKRGPPSLV